MKGISSHCVDFEVSKLLILFRISSYVTLRKENTLLFIFSLMSRMLGERYKSNTSFVSTTNSLSLSIFEVFPIFTKNLLKLSATFSVSDMILQLSLKHCWFYTLLEPTIWFEKFGLTTVQKFLLSAMRLTF